MISYSAKSEFQPREQVLLELLTSLIPRIPEELGDPIRCHELVRAVSRLYQLPWADGHFRRTEHSWIYTRPLGPGKNYILDVYAVGRLPMVQLMDAHYYRDLYVEGPERSDLDFESVSKIMNCLSAWQHQWKIG
jgi:hypothetical protein